MARRVRRVTTYIDLHSLHPNPDIASSRAKALNLSGALLPFEYRDSVLIGHGINTEAVIAHPLEFPYWRMLDKNIRLISALDGSEDSVQDRYKRFSLAWAARQLGETERIARGLEKNPPKTKKSSRWKLLTRAQQKIVGVALNGRNDGLVPTSLPTLLREKKPRVEETPYTWKIVEPEDIERLELLLREWEQPIGIDVETDLVGGKPNETKDRLVGLAIAVGNEVFYGPADDREWVELLKDTLPELPWVGHNAKYDMTVLHRCGIRTGELHGDGMLSAYLLGTPEAGLKASVLREFDVRMRDYSDVVGERKASEVPIEELASYCSADAWWGLRLESHLRGLLAEKLLTLYEEVDVPLVRVLSDMEIEGITISREAAEERVKEIDGFLRELGIAINGLAQDDGYVRTEKRKRCPECHGGKKKRLTCFVCKGEGGFSEPQPINPGSNQQLAEWLHETVGLPVQSVTPKTGKPSLSELSLLRMREMHVAIPFILRWNKLTKEKAFLEDWLAESEKDGRIHSVFTNSLVSTGRLSSREPNLQQVSLDWRDNFIARPGYLLVALDYAQLEVRLAAVVSKDPKLLEIVNDPEGNIHAETMEQVFGIPKAEQYQYPALKVAAKVYLFRSLYLGKEDGVIEGLEKESLRNPELNIPIPSKKEARRRLQMLHETYKGYFLEYAPAVIEKARYDTGKVVHTIFGRPRYLPNLSSPIEKLREAAEREAVNHTVQGTAADLLRVVMPNVAGLESGKLLLQVHDELVSEVEEDRAEWYSIEAAKLMEAGQPFSEVPLKVDAGWGLTWKACHK